MAVEELQTIRLKDDFYRDGFYKALTALSILLVAIVLLISVSVYLVLSKPKPVIFATDKEWRVLPPVPVAEPFLSTPDLLLWSTHALSVMFHLDFVSYHKELGNHRIFFTDKGWQKFLAQLAIYANQDTINNAKLFINGTAAGAPYILNQGLLEEKYSWWIQIPINVSYSSAEKNYVTPLIIQALVVRVPTLNNIEGVAIDDMIVSKGGSDQTRTHG